MSIRDLAKPLLELLNSSEYPEKNLPDFKMAQCEACGVLLMLPYEKDQAFKNEVIKNIEHFRDRNSDDEYINTAAERALEAFRNK